MTLPGGESFSLQLLTCDILGRLRTFAAMLLRGVASSPAAAHMRHPWQASNLRSDASAGCGIFACSCSHATSSAGFEPTQHRFRSLAFIRPALRCAEFADMQAKMPALRCAEFADMQAKMPCLAVRRVRRHAGEDACLAVCKVRRHAGEDACLAVCKVLQCCKIKEKW